MYLTQTLHRALQQDPRRELTVTGDRVRTVAESIDRVSRLAGGLRELGVGRGDRVGMLSLNSDRYHEYLLAVPWADAVVHPVNTRWSAAEAAYALDESGTEILLVDDTFAPLAGDIRGRCPGLRTLVFCGDGPCPDGAVGYEELIAGSDPIPDARRGGDEMFGLFYTGGTTGTPRGVMLSHDSLMLSALGCQASGAFISRDGRLLHVAPMFHLADIAIWTCGLLAGSAHVTLSGFTPEGTLDEIVARGVTDVLLVPTMIQLMVDHPNAASADLSGVRRVLYGTSPISESLLARAVERFSGAGFTQAYGMTELAPVATILEPADHEVPALRRSAGRAAPHAEVRVVGPDDVELPRGTVGEIVVRGDNVMLGYWQREQETETALRGGWMHTGDGGYMDENGYVFVVDRMKDMIISGGENVYSVEVENVVARHPAVAGCAVIGVPDQRWGERVHAVVVLLPGHELTEAELRDFCREDIAGYKCPRSVEFVDQLPLSGTGKILKRELRRRYWPDGERQVR
ncbi:long-chain-fatty-acid--CoA ligase [Actinophytocola gossypii]|uniref:Long-chain-fatty-acid--CoA ligase n=1 Tax=Actinophytocola gossypii TaxID=2812003 RepID=A0ABT2J2J0_9PSEU|nr:long-chain-fatty-acid--CoA ligase [Actinophytocola gossypii]MCT2582074.1 long-chain-fatty-acid--CoA ligase [Actinophytocola gossypii]